MGKISQAVQGFVVVGSIASATTDARAANTTIDFTSNVTLTPSGLIDRIPPLTFSHDLYTHPDGFTQYSSGSYNFYGEEDELITFDAPVKLVTLDLTMPFSMLPQPTHLHLQMLDSNNVQLGEVIEDPTGVVVMVPLNTGKVKKLVFHFEGGDPTFYGDGRTHAWYFIDNLVYDPAGCVTDSDCSPPTGVCEPDGSCGQCSATVSCTAADQCHTSTCNLTTAQCAVAALQDGTACDDGTACTQSDTCQAGACIGGSPVMCPAPDECHDLGSCQSASGTCSNPNKVDGTPCTGGACAAGVCVASTSASSTASSGSAASASATSGASTSGVTSGPGTTSAGVTSGPGTTSANASGTGSMTTTSGSGGSDATGTGGSGNAIDISRGCGCIAAGSDADDVPKRAPLLIAALGGLLIRRSRSKARGQTSRR